MINFTLNNQLPREINMQNDVIFTFIVPALSLFGLVFQALSLMVFSNPRFKELLYHYLKMESFNLLVNFLNASFKPVFHCFTCKISKTYFAQLYFLIFIEYGSSVLELNAIINRIISTFCCYMLLCNKNSKTKCLFVLNYYKIINLIINFFSCVIFSFHLTTYRIIGMDFFDTNLNKTNTKFLLQRDKFSDSSLKKILEVSAFIFRDGLSLSILTVLNILVFIRVKKSFSKKRKIFSSSQIDQIDSLRETSFFNHQKSNKKKVLNRINKFEYRHSIIVIVSCINYIIGRIPIMVYFILKNLSNENDLLLKGAVLTVFVSYNLNFFIYYLSNKRFQKILKEMFKRK